MLEGTCSLTWRALGRAPTSFSRHCSMSCATASGHSSGTCAMTQRRGMKASQKRGCYHSVSPYFAMPHDLSKHRMMAATSMWSLLPGYIHTVRGPKHSAGKALTCSYRACDICRNRVSLLSLCTATPYMPAQHSTAQHSIAQHSTAQG